MLVSNFARLMCKIVLTDQTIWKHDCGRSAVPQQRQQRVSDVQALPFGFPVNS